ncbi:coiled-coil domain-containing protein 115 isoform X1 [Vitis riparia]|uniref:coiled-coil domain-containing protein 115 isoform X1 n=1 Tax=Vitis riparia TaxID=96939 RepID=UPI00155B1C4A|nr:coiled-coil domain-containing protein 115 isoform X1 [Vitis riparia]
MEDQDKARTSENQLEEEQLDEGENVVTFLDSMDAYLTLIDSLSSTLRQGWLELASARHSMGASRISSSLFDLKLHSAATSLRVTEDDVDSKMNQPHFTLCKWASSDNGKCCSGEAKFDGDELQKKSVSPQLRYRGTSQLDEPQEIQEKSPTCKSPTSNGSPLSLDSPVQKQRHKSLSVFGTLVSPKLRAAQFSFETALETIVEIANMRSSMLSAFDQVQKDIESISTGEQ